MIDHLSSSSSSLYCHLYLPAAESQTCCPQSSLLLNMRPSQFFWSPVLSTVILSGHCTFCFKRSLNFSFLPRTHKTATSNCAKQDELQICTEAVPKSCSQTNSQDGKSVKQTEFDRKLSVHMLLSFCTMCGSVMSDTELEI